MKKVAVLVTVLTLMLTSQMSYAADATGKRETTNPVELKSTHSIKYVQNSNLEIDKIRNNKEVVLLVDSSSAMMETVKEERSPFDYALFSGSETENLITESGTIRIDGDVHSNKSIVPKAGGSIYVDGNLEASEKVELDTGIIIEGDPVIKEGANVLKMNDLSDKFKVNSQASKTFFSTDDYTYDTSKRWCDLIINKIDGSILDDSFYPKPKENMGCYLSKTASGKDKWTVTGNKIVLTKDKPLYFDGDLEFGIGEIYGEGYIVASGDISFSTSAFKSTDIGIYSVNGNVNFHTGDVKLKGLIYTPKGYTKASSGGIDVTGSIVGNNITSGTGKINIAYDKDLGTVKQFKSYEDLERTISVAKTVSQNFIKRLYNNYNKSDLKFNIVTYNDKASVAYPDFYNITKDGYNDPYTYIGNIALGSDGANLGDGLRKAYYLLSRSDDTTADKYIIVLSAGEPNKWTKNDGPSAGIYETDDQVVSDSQIKKDTPQAFAYSKEIAGMIASTEIKSFFVDVCSDETIKDFSDIVASAGTSAELFNPEAASGTTFDSALSEILVTNIGDTIMNRATYIEPEITVSFTEKVPAQVEVVEAPDFEPMTPGRDLELKNINKVVKNPVGDDKFEVTLDDIQIKVKYNEFDKTDNLINYEKIPVTYTISNPVTGQIIDNKFVDIDPLDVTINWLIDTQ